MLGAHCARGQQYFERQKYQPLSPDALAADGGIASIWR
jgi:hypothetical protein